jgi:hypothetical protein
MSCLARVLAVLMLVTGVAHADRIDLHRPISIKIQGHVGPPRGGETVIAELTLRKSHATIRFQVREIWVLSGDAMGVDVLHEVEPYTPNMMLAGPAEVVDRLANGTSDELVDVVGYFRRGSRLFSLSSVEPVTKR